MAPALTVTELRQALAALSLDSRGTKDTLRKRLARFSRSTSASPSRPPSPPLDHGPLDKPPDQPYHSYLVFDVEATCEEIPQPWGKLAFAYPNEIIEWPVILLQWRRKAGDADAQGDDDSSDGWELVKTDEYHSFVRPTWAPKLSPFCTDLTGITQDDVDKAPTFPQLCKRFYTDFILPRRLFTPENRTIWVTDGPWDLRDFVAKTCYLSKTPRPPWLAGDIIDLRNLTSAFFASLKKQSRSPQPAPVSSTAAGALGATTSVSAEGEDDDEEAVEPATPAPLPAPLASASAPSPPVALLPDPTPSPPIAPTYLPSSQLTSPPNLSLPSVLSALTLPPFQGRLHSGLSDARNAARILADLAARGCVLAANRRVPEGGRGARERKWGWMSGGGEVRWEEWSRREGERFVREVAEGKREPWVRR